jgi:hypothetical protein
VIIANDIIDSSREGVPERSEEENVGDLIANLRGSTQIIDPGVESENLNKLSEHHAY